MWFGGGLNHSCCQTEWQGSPLTFKPRGFPKRCFFWFSFPPQNLSSFGVDRVELGRTCDFGTLLPACWVPNGPSGFGFTPEESNRGAGKVWVCLVTDRGGSLFFGFPLHQPQERYPQKEPGLKMFETLGHAAIGWQ